MMVKKLKLIILLIAIFEVTALNGQVLVKNTGDNSHTLVSNIPVDTLNSPLTPNASGKNPGGETLQINPTPVHNEATLTFLVKKDSYITVNLLDITGLKVKNLISGYYNQGWRSENISTSDLSPGRYIMVFQSNDEKKILPFVILR